MRNFYMKFLKYIWHRKKIVFSVIFLTVLLLGVLSFRNLKDGYSLRFFVPYYKNRIVYDADIFHFKPLGNGFATDSKNFFYQGFLFSSCKGFRILDASYAANNCNGFIYRKNGQLIWLPFSDGASFELIGNGYAKDINKTFFDNGLEFKVINSLLTPVEDNEQYDAADSRSYYKKGIWAAYNEEYNKQLKAEEIDKEEQRKEAAKNCKPDSKLKLIRTKNGKEEELFAKYNYRSDVFSWNNSLYFTDDNKSVVKYDLVSGVKKIIFTKDDAHLDRQHEGDTDLNIDIIHDTLFISYGGYLVDGKLFALKLASNSQPVLIKKGSNLSVQKVNNKYFIVGGEGDAGWGFTTYSLFDPVSLDLMPEIRLEYDNGNGNMFVGVTDKGLLAADTSNSEKHMDLLSSIYLIDYKDPSKKTELINMKELAEDSYQIYFDEQNKKIYMLGSLKDDLYAIGFNDKKISKIFSNVEKYNHDSDIYISNAGSDFICFGTSTNLNLKTLAIKKQAESCEKEEKDLLIKDRILEIKLPSNYRYECSDTN
jgi:hypothetical protein